MLWLMVIIVMVFFSLQGAWFRHDIVIFPSEVLQKIGKVKTAVDAILPCFLSRR
jgi:hypothetical protein